MTTIAHVVLLANGTVRGLDAGGRDVGWERPLDWFTWRTAILARQPEVELETREATHWIENEHGARLRVSRADLTAATWLPPAEPMEDKHGQDDTQES